MKNLTPDLEKPEVFRRVERYLNRRELKTKESDHQRPWGGFFVMDTKCLNLFIHCFFGELMIKEQPLNSLSPKVLIVKPKKRLSWQYHNRRSEYWRVIAGPVGIMRSDTNKQPSCEKLSTDDGIHIKKRERHRLIGLNGWGVVAEIWQHEDPGDPSDENDIVRLDDDFGR